MVKKKRIKKKNKKVIPLTFTTSKAEYANNIIALQEKEKLYEIFTVESIELEMSKNGIHISVDDVIKRYDECYDIDSIVKEYHTIYNEQLDILSSLGLLFDDDCIIYYITKVISDYSKENNIPDPIFIIQSCMQLSSLSDKKKPQYFFELLKTINLLKDYNKERKLEKIFEKTGFDIEWMISDLIGINIHNCFMDLEMTKKITNEAFKLVENYDLNNPEYIIADSIGLLAMHGYMEVKNKFEKSIVDYPDNQLRMYQSILSELVFIAEKTNMFEEFIELYNKALNIKLKSKEDEEDLEIIIDNYSELIKKHKKG